MAITKEMTIGEVVRTYQQTIRILMDFGMGCVGCPSAQSETLEEAATIHGIDVNKLVERLNQAIQYLTSGQKIAGSYSKRRV